MQKKPAIETFIASFPRVLEQIFHVIFFLGEITKKNTKYRKKEENPERILFFCEGK